MNTSQELPHFIILRVEAASTWQINCVQPHTTLMWPLYPCPCVTILCMLEGAMSLWFICLMCTHVQNKETWEKNTSDSSFHSGPIYSRVRSPGYSQPLFQQEKRPFDPPMTYTPPRVLHLAISSSRALLLEVRYHHGYCVFGSNSSKWRSCVISKPVPSCLANRCFSFLPCLFLLGWSPGTISIFQPDTTQSTSCLISHMPGVRGEKQLMWPLSMCTKHPEWPLLPLLTIVVYSPPPPLYIVYCLPML